MKRAIFLSLLMMPGLCFAMRSSGGGGSGSSISAGASTLAVGTGTATNFTNNVTSPTAAASFLGSQFRVTSNGTTSFISIDPSILGGGGIVSLSTMTAGATNFVAITNSPLAYNTTTYLSSMSVQGYFYVNSTSGTAYESRSNTISIIPSKDFVQVSEISQIFNDSTHCDGLSQGLYVTSYNQSLAGPYSRLSLFSPCSGGDPRFSWGSYDGAATGITAQWTSSNHAFSSTGSYTGGIPNAVLSASVVNTEGDKEILGVYEMVDTGYGLVPTPIYTFHINTTTVRNELAFKSGTNDQYVSFKSTYAVAENQAYTLPNTSGSAGQVLARGASDPNAKIPLYWTTATGGTGGSALTIQDEGSALTAVGIATINFVGSGVTAALTGTSSVTVTINGGGTSSSINARVFNSTAPVIPARSTMTFTFDGEDSDTDNIHSQATNTSRLTANTSGHYAIFGTVVYSTPVAGLNFQDIQFKLNATTPIARSVELTALSGTAADQDSLTAYTQIDLLANDYVEMIMRNLNGTNSIIISSRATFGMALISGGGGASGSSGMTVGNTNYVWITSGTIQQGAFNTSSGTVSGQFNADFYGNNIVPTTDNLWTLGTTDNRYKRIYVSSGITTKNNVLEVINASNSSPEGRFSFINEDDTETRVTGGRGQSGYYVFSSTRMKEGGFGTDNFGAGNLGRFLFSYDGFVSGIIPFYVDRDSTTINNLFEVLGGTFAINGIKYRAPQTRASGTQVLQNDGAAGIQNLSWATSSGGGTTDKFTAGAGLPTLSSGCAAAIQYSTGIVNYSACAFPKSATSYWQITVPVPSTYNSESYTARVIWTSTASSGNVSWNVQLAAIADTESLNATFGTAVEITDGASANSAFQRTSASGTITPNGTVTNAKYLLLQLYRAVGVANDTLSGDARFIALELIRT